ncbi:MAG: hypothetical protein B7Z55_04315 [Planctomycetales bacterium 12-60-4]|nr:MAG: hypothetical protein B7Z55_04315 [Planctomycetales bacterium 12-60-4]
MTIALGLAMQVGQPAPSETPNFPALRDAYNQYGFEGQYEQRYPFDSNQNWVHGYFQEIPAYGGHAFYRPYNYKDVLSQSQTAAGWGASPVLPYSQQFWHRYHDRATMLKLSQVEQPVVPQPFHPGMGQPAPAGVVPAGVWSPQPTQYQPQPAAAPQQQFVIPPGYQLVPAAPVPVQNVNVTPYYGFPVNTVSGPVISGPALVPNQ